MRITLVILIAIFFCSCKTYYYFDSCGNEHSTHRKIQEKEIVRFPDSNPIVRYQYYYVLRSGKAITRGNLFDTTNWQQLKINLLKPLPYERFSDKCRCDKKAEMKTLLKSKSKKL